MNNIKRIIVLFYTFVFLLFINTSFATTGTVNTSAARIRESASTNSEIITKVYEDEKIEILSEEGDWYKVNANGKTGFVSKSLIKVTNNTNTTSSNNTNTDNNTTNSTNEITSGNNLEELEDKVVINKDTSLRLLPNFASNELRILTKNTEVIIEKELNNWVKISIPDDSIGWILKNNFTNNNTENSVKNNTVDRNTTEENTTEKSTVENNNIIDNTINSNTVKSNTAEENTTGKNTVETNTTNNNTVENNTTKQNITQNKDNNENNISKEENSNLNIKKGRVNVETANVREKASKSSKIIAHLDEGNEVKIIEEEGDWYKITTSKISSGYVSKQLITIFSSEVSSRSLQEKREEEIIDKKTTTKDSVKENSINEEIKTSINGEDVVSFAKKYLGTNYVLGGKTPETGFDCSGFTRFVFKNFGYSLGNVAAEQDTVGDVVERNNLIPGDLILFLSENKAKIGHTGIYIGNNEFIHAANPERGVVIDNLTTVSYYNERFVTARRIVN